MPSSGTLLTLHNTNWYGVAYQSSTGPVLESSTCHPDKEAVINYIKAIQASRDYKGYVLVQITPLFQDTPGYHPPFPSSHSHT